VGRVLACRISSGTDKTKTDRLSFTMFRIKSLSYWRRCVDGMQGDAAPAQVSRKKNPAEGELIARFVVPDKNVT
jgi:hypothetical protein